MLRISIPQDDGGGDEGVSDNEGSLFLNPLPGVKQDDHEGAEDESSGDKGLNYSDDFVDKGPFACIRYSGTDHWAHDSYVPFLGETYRNEVEDNHSVQLMENGYYRTAII